MNFIRNKMNIFNVRGQLNWRYACLEFQKQNPIDWGDSKTFKGVRK